MSLSSKIALAKELIENAESSLRSAKQILAEFVKDSGKKAFAKIAADLPSARINEEDDDEVQIIEGVFDGQKMIGPDTKSYSVPANYASKSKLIPGDILKLTVQPDGSFVYKQISPVERKRVIGILTYEEGQYKVLAEGKAYKVLLASVTYFKGEVGDKVALMIPTLEESEWGAIENILPKDTPDEDFDIGINDKI